MVEELAGFRGAVKQLTSSTTTTTTTTRTVTLTTTTTTTADNCAIAGSTQDTCTDICANSLGVSCYEQATVRINTDLAVCTEYLNLPGTTPRDTAALPLNFPTGCSAFVDATGGFSTVVNTNGYGAGFGCDAAPAVNFPLSVKLCVCATTCPP
eukprot:Lankesteria_metandrocarpae@DN4698_c0_g1_i1.p1